MFTPEEYFNEKSIGASDFYSPLPPPPNPIHESPINLSGGRPNSGFYPIKSIQLEIRDTPFDNDTSSTLTIPLHSNDPEVLSITDGFQYAPPKGYPQLLSLVSQISQFHNTTPTEYDSLITSGSGDSLSKILAAFGSMGDTALVEAYTYTPIFATFDLHGVTKIPFPVDFTSSTTGHIDPDALETTLATWSTGRYKDLKFPKFLYTVPTQNPSGLLTPWPLIQRITAIAEKYHILIIEDDPDGFIRHLPSRSYQAYVESLHNVSYLSTGSQVVIHMGTFSKTISPGVRCGFIISHPVFINRLFELSKTTTKAPSGYSQTVLANLFHHWSRSHDKSHGLLEGYLSWCYKVSVEYTNRSSAVFEVLSQAESVRNGYIKPIRPEGGMFFVVHVKILPSQFEAMRYKFVKFGVLVILGHMMSWDKEFVEGAQFVRLTFANEEAEVLREGVRRLDSAVLEYFNELQ